MLNELLLHIIRTLKEGKNIATFVVSATLFLLFFLFFFGIVTIPTPKGVIGFYRMEPPSAFEYFYIFFSTVVSAIILTLTIDRARRGRKARGMEKEGGRHASGGGKASYIAGLSASIFGAVCPACLGINFLLFGNVFTAQLSFLIPYIFWVQVAGIVFLVFALFLVAKSSYEDRCISCRVPSGSSDEVVERTDTPQIFLWGVVGLAAVFLAVQVVWAFGGTKNVGDNDSYEIIANGQIINIDKVIEEVTPQEGFVVPVRWGGIVTKMIDEGVLDPQKLEDILKKRYGQQMKPEWREILAGKDTELTIDSDNAVFMMYLLWTFAKHNKNQILFDSPFAKYFQNYDIGVGRAGYGDVELLTLTPEQQGVAKRVAENAYRPCCGNSTARPDCSHGYSALGLVELMASQGFSEKEIFDAFVKFNSFWFPETYIKDALYFRITEGKRWEDVDKELIASAKYSSLQGAFAVKKYLKENFGI